MLEQVATQAERTTVSLSDVMESASRTTESTERAASTLESLTREAKEGQARASEQIEKSVTALSNAVAPFSERLRTVFADLKEIGEQAKRSSDESFKAQQASVEVLSHLTRVTRRITDVIKSS